MKYLKKLCHSRKLKVPYLFREYWAVHVEILFALKRKKPDSSLIFRSAAATFIFNLYSSVSDKTGSLLFTVETGCDHFRIKSQQKYWSHWAFLQPHKVENSEVAAVCIFTFASHNNNKEVRTIYYQICVFGIASDGQSRFLKVLQETLTSTQN